MLCSTSVLTVIGTLQVFLDDDDDDKDCDSFYLQNILYFLSVDCIETRHIHLPLVFTHETESVATK